MVGALTKSVTKGLRIYKTLRCERRFRWFVGVGALDDPLRFVDCTHFFEDFSFAFSVEAGRRIEQQPPDNAIGVFAFCGSSGAPTPTGERGAWVL